MLIYPWTQQNPIVGGKVSNPVHLSLKAPFPHREEGVGQAQREGLSLWQVLLALCLSWLFCFVLTVTNTFPESPTAYGYMARTDTKGSVLSQAPWFRFPYPGEEK